MNKSQTLTAVAALIAGLGYAGAAWADHLAAPAALTCNAIADPVLLDWGDVDGAQKYSVDFECMMTEIIDDSEVTTTIEFDIGTGDREDGGLPEDSDLEVTYAELDAAAGQNLSGFECSAKVKALDPGRGKGRQNHLFSSPETDCGTVAEHDD